MQSHYKPKHQWASHCESVMYQLHSQTLNCYRIVFTANEIIGLNPSNVFDVLGSCTKLKELKCNGTKKKKKASYPVRLTTVY